MNELALFAGAGGGILGGKLLGWTPICAVEIEKYPREILLQRQRDGLLPEFPIWDDIKTFDGVPWRGSVDIVTGGFPCQDISRAGGSDAGIDGEKSGLWREMRRVICEVRPKYALVENVPALTHRGLDSVLRDLAEIGYNARWCVLGAADVGAPHRRDRIWIFAWSESMADADRHNPPERENLRSKRDNLAGSEPCGGSNSRRNSDGEQKSGSKSIGSADVADADHADRGSVEKIRSEFRERVYPEIRYSCGQWWNSDPGADACTIAGGGQASGGRISHEPELGRVVNGMADRVDRLRAIGNGQVPATMAAAFQILSSGIVN